MRLAIQQVSEGPVECWQQLTCSLDTGCCSGSTPWVLRYMEKRVTSVCARLPCTCACINGSICTWPFKIQNLAYPSLAVSYRVDRASARARFARPQREPVPDSARVQNSRCMPKYYKIVQRCGPPLSRPRAVIPWADITQLCCHEDALLVAVCRLMALLE